MKYCYRILAFVCSIWCSSFICQAQPFIKEINAFKQADSLNMPPQNAILFAGSSTFRLWHNIKDDFKDFTIINRGFGGSALPDVIRYTEEILFPYQPKQVVIYCGENDFAIDKFLPVDSVVNRFSTLFGMIRKRLPNTHISFVSMKPSPSRWHLKEKMLQANKSISEFLGSKHNTSYIDIWSAMLNESGLPRPEIFLKDSLHMNGLGYIIWKHKILPKLLN